MLGTRLGAFAAAVMMAGSGVAAAGWTESPGPYGHEVRQLIQATDGTLLVPSYGGLAALPVGATRWGWAGLEASRHGLYAVAQALDGTVLATTERGLYRRTPMSGSWEHIGVDVAFDALVPLSDGSMVGLVYNVLWRSSDGVHDWHELPASLPIADPHFGFELQQLALLADRRLLAATNDGLFRADPAGTGWEALVAGVYALGVQVAADGTAFALVPHGGGAELLRSTDGGDTWSSILVSDMPTVDLTLAPGGLVVLGSQWGTSDVTASYAVLWISRDGGDTFDCLLGHNVDCSLSTTPPPVTALSRLRLLADGSLLVAGRPLDLSGLGGARGLWRSPDLGLSWHPAGLDDVTVASITELADGTLWCGTDAPLFTTTPDSFDWRPVTDGLRTARVRHVLALGDTVLASVDNDGLQRTVDGGRSWIRLGPASTLVDDLDANPAGDIAVAAGRSLWLWHAGSWTDLMADHESPPRSSSVALSPTGTLCVGSDTQTILCTTDHGASWLDHRLELNDRVRVVATGTGVMVAVLTRVSDWSHPRFLRSEDGGASWDEVWSAESGVDSLSRDASGRLIGSLHGGHVFEADTAAITWTLGTRPLNEVLAVARDTTGRWYAAGGRRELVTSEDGIDWQPFDAWLTARYPNGWQIDELAAGDHHVFAGTSRHGLLVRRLPSNPPPAGGAATPTPELD